MIDQTTRQVFEQQLSEIDDPITRAWLISGVNFDEIEALLTTQGNVKFGITHARPIRLAAYIDSVISDTDIDSDT